MSSPRSIDEALARARVFNGQYTTEDLDSARRNIACRLHELRWLRFLDAASPRGSRAPEPPAALHEQAALDLRLVCRGTVHHHGAAGRITDFETDRDPDGALPFACLLYLADRAEGARFWWHYAAGAGNVTAALCIYLLHLHHGDVRDAQHWASQIDLLNDQGWDSYTPVAHQAHAGHREAPPGPSVRYRLPAPCPTVSAHALKDAVDNLHTPHNADLGPVPQPIPALASHWAGLVTS
ncbi:hypothetical protein [Streptomyces sp. NPDC093260]|uniref:hypothetical protein n=1 Tax=Streptomyces sp. NPDC093260 TaxID=3155073 RepID=UPI00343ADF01